MTEGEQGGSVKRLQSRWVKAVCVGYYGYTTSQQISSQQSVRSEYYIIGKEEQMLVFSNMCSNISHLQVVLLPYMSNISTEHAPSHDYRDTPTKPRETAKDRNITHAYSCCHYHM